MAGRIARAFAVLLFPLVLTGCLLAPGKFTSTLTVNADRSFAFTYVGEVIAIDAGDDLKNLGGDNEGGGDPSAYFDDQPMLQKIAFAPDDDPADEAAKKAAKERKNKAIAEALTKEAGYRKVEYLGDGRFTIDYAISGKLTHNFLYPFNLDAQAIVPFIALELRANGTVRVRAPAFGNETNMPSGSGMPDMGADKMEGTFTLDTDAEIVSQNNEGGPAAAGGRKKIVWTANPLTKTAPMAVLRFK